MLEFELIVALLSILVIAIPIAAWIILRRMSSADRMQTKTGELHAIENSLSLMVKELEDTVEKGLGDMEEAADKLNQMIVSADDRIRQFEYYYEYGDELKPLSQPNTIPESSISQTASPAPSQPSALKHREVHELSRKGWSAAQIARHTGMSTDEVQLIVNLMEISATGLGEPTPYTRQSIM